MPRSPKNGRQGETTMKHDHVSRRRIIRGAAGRTTRSFAQALPRSGSTS
jgi:hypothetical protein